MIPELGREHVSLKHGYWFYFDDEGAQIVAFASALNGKEVVFVDDEIVSNKRSFSLKTPHTFEHNGRHYELVIACENLLTGALSCSLFKDGILLSNTRKSYFQSLKSFFIVTFLIGLVMGFGLVWISHR